MQIEPINISVPEAARFLGCCRAKLYQLFAAGQVRAVKQGRRTLVPVESLRQYAQSLPEMRPTQPS